MKAGVIGGALGGVERLGEVLGDFDPTYVTATYSDWVILLDTIERDLQPRGQIRRSPQSIWPRYCQTILSAAAFMQQFKNAEELYTWAAFFNQDKRARPFLPLLIEVEVYGIGFPLATHDAGLGIFFDLLRYKVEKTGSQLVEVDPKHTSQVCAGCGALVKKALHVRLHDCPYCGLILD